MSRHKRAELAFRKLYERYMTLGSFNCNKPWEYRKTLLKRLAVVIPLSNTNVRIVDGYLT